MEPGNILIQPNMNYPILFIPKKCTTLEGNFKYSDDVYIDVSVTSLDSEGNSAIIYNGFCNVKLVDSYNLTVNRVETPESLIDESQIDQMPVILSESNPFPPYSQSQVWIDPSRSPYVYNHYDPSVREQYSNCEAGGLVTVQQHNTYITQNVYNCNESTIYNYKEPEQSPVRDFECKRYRKVQETMMMAQMDGNLNVYEQDELECGVFLSQLPEEIMNVKQTREREEQTVQKESNALKQLMSPGIQSTSKQRKTIMFLGNDSHSGQTIQNISYNDPLMRCAEINADMECGLVNGQSKDLVYSGASIPSRVSRAPTEQDKRLAPDFVRRMVASPDLYRSYHHNMDSAAGAPKKKYQCDKCKQIFHQLSTFRMHIVGSYPDIHKQSSIKELAFMCQDCGKSLKTLRKFEIHCLGHGDPDLECSKCGKVFSSKFSLRVHKQIHNRKYQCAHCAKSYAKNVELQNHLEKVHFMFSCYVDNCEFVCSSAADLQEHQRSHRSEEILETLKVEEPEVEVLNESLLYSQKLHVSSSDYDFSMATHDLSEPSRDPVIPSDDLAEPSNDLAGSSHDLPGSSHDLAGSSRDLAGSGHDEPGLDKDLANSADDSAVAKIRQADSVIAQVMSNSIFLLSSTKARRHCCRRTCAVCQKSFDRIDDLKRHLIEHVIKSTLAKIPVTRTGGYNITCEVCQIEQFTRVDKYKSHLREHAKLTIYKCTLCDKSFSDSSNFSKHKKIHGVAYLQCDLCLRKFNSKKMIGQHMEQHNRTAPVKCDYCDRVFHFESMLNKHVRSAHCRDDTLKFRCRFCEQIFRCLKEKWDHEWRVHSVRKEIVDCQICGAQYRMYSELRRHCLDEHGLSIPLAKILLKKKRAKRKAKVSY